MNVNLFLVWLLLAVATLQTTPILSNLELLRKLDKKRKMAAKPAAPDTIGTPKYDEESFMNEYKRNQRRNLQDNEPSVTVDYDPSDTFIDLNFEAREVTEAINFIEFKMNEVNSLIQECINNRFATNLMAEVRHVRQECVGASYQILIFNYQESVRKIKEILLELIKIKLEHVQTEHDEEVAFFLDVLDQLIDGDFSLPESLQIVKQSSQYYVSPRFFDKIIELSKTELQAFHEVHKRLRDARTDIQKELEAHAKDEEGYVELLESRGDSYDVAFTPRLPVIESRKMRSRSGLQISQPIDKDTEGSDFSKNKIQDFLKTKEGLEMMKGVMEGMKKRHQQSDSKKDRSLTDAAPVADGLARATEMGWEKDDGKRGTGRDDIMGWDGK
jgi:hypothetical protein